MAWQIQNQYPTNITKIRAPARNYLGLKVLCCIVCTICIIGVWKFETARVGIYYSWHFIDPHPSGLQTNRNRVLNSKFRQPSQTDLIHDAYSDAEGEQKGIMNKRFDVKRNPIKQRGPRTQGRAERLPSRPLPMHPGRPDSGAKPAAEGQLFCRKENGIPSILLIGAMKAGTSTFWAALKSQPGIRAGMRKESKFFGQQWWIDMMPHRNRKAPKTNEEYAKTFGTCNPTVHYIDATPLSSVLEANPTKDMKQLYTADEQENLTFLMILQEPVRRFVSQYNFLQKPGIPEHNLRSKISGEINKYVDAHFDSGEEADFGLYTRNSYGDIVEHFREEFPKAKIILIQSTYFFQHEQDVIDGIMRVIGEVPVRLRNLDMKVNVNHRRKDLLSAKNHDRLVDKFKSQIVRLREMVDKLGDITIFPSDTEEFISGLMPVKYCQYINVTHKQFSENVIPIGTEDANDPKVTAEYIYEKYYKNNKPFLIKNAAQHLFDNYADHNTEFLLNNFNITDKTNINIASGRIVNLFERKSLAECLLDGARCVYFRKFHFIKTGKEKVFAGIENNLRELHRKMIQGMKQETFMWGKNTSGTYNFHISSWGGALPHSHSQAINVLHQGAKRWIMVSANDYHICEDQIDFELHKECPVTRPYKQLYFNRSDVCSLMSEQWINRLKTIDFPHYDFVQEAGDLVFVPMTTTHATLDLCAPTIGNVFMGDITAFKRECLQPDSFKHQPCQYAESMVPNSPKCMKKTEFITKQHDRRQHPPWLNNMHNKQNTYPQRNPSPHLQWELGKQKKWGEKRVPPAPTDLKNKKSTHQSPPPDANQPLDFELDHYDT